VIDRWKRATAIGAQTPMMTAEHNNV